MWGSRKERKGAVLLWESISYVKHQRQDFSFVLHLKIDSGRDSLILTISYCVRHHMIHCIVENDSAAPFSWVNNASRDLIVASGNIKGVQYLGNVAAFLIMHLLITWFLLLVIHSCCIFKQCVTCQVDEMSSADLLSQAEKVSRLLLFCPSCPLSGLTCNSW